VLTRASAAGGQRYAATWTGDNVSSWAHIDLSISMIANLGLSGFAYSGADIGGFGGAKPSPDLLTRWIEIGAFNPLFRDHYMEKKPAQEVWVDGPEHEAIRRRFIEERYRLLPYLYGLAEENSRTGLPILRPVFLEFPSVLGWKLERNETAGAFMLGPDLLVAPSPTLESPEAYRVLLPGDGWYDYWTGARIEGHAVEVTPRIDALPVFVRPGAVIARQPLVQSTGERPVGNLALDFYPGGDMRGSVYADDGISLAYRQGGFYRRGVWCEPVHGGFKVVLAPREGRYAPWWPAVDVHVVGVGRVTMVERDDGGEAIIRWTR
jgi:alpha-glucosidase